MTDITKIIDHQLEAYNKADFARFSACYHPAILSYDIETNGIIQERCGQQFFDYYKEKFQSNPDLYCEVIDRVTHHNLVVDKERISSFQGGSHQEMVIYQVQKNLITKMWFTKEIRE